jgi:hypothetical protein
LLKWIGKEYYKTKVIRLPQIGEKSLNHYQQKPNTEGTNIEMVYFSQGLSGVPFFFSTN